MSVEIGWRVDHVENQFEKNANRILGWSEALDRHEQSDPLNARGYIMQIAPIALERSCKSNR